MIRTAIYLIKTLIVAITALLFGSCTGVSGNGKIKADNRVVDQPFTGIEVSSGLSAYVSQGDKTSITVEADDNLLPLIQTEVSNGVLKIYSKQNLQNGSSVHVYVTLPQVNSLQATAGSLLESKTVLKSGAITLESGSGSEIDVTLQATNVSCTSGSGSSMALKGVAVSITASSASGSSLDAKGLKVEEAKAQASSGSSLSVSPSKHVKASASSGASVTYYTEGGITADTEASSGGSVSKG